MHAAAQPSSRDGRRPPDGSAVHYERHRPELTTLYRLVQQHLAYFIAHTEASTGAELPRFIKDEFEAFLECGILAHGFLRLRCAECGHDRLLAFSCKRRGFCPSCGARRMSQTAAHLVDHVIPSVPVRQWVLSLPIPLRLLLASRPELLTAVLQVVQREIGRYLLGSAGLGATQAQGGAVTLIQRFGSAANLNVHLHCLVLDGVYRVEEVSSGGNANGKSADGSTEAVEQGAPVFVEAAAPSDEQLQEVLQRIIVGLMKRLTRLGVLAQEGGHRYLADGQADDESASGLRALQAAAITYRIAFGPRAGQKVLTIKGAMAREPAGQRRLCAEIDGFSLHAAVQIAAHERKRLEHLCRYITRPALANERVRCDASGQVVLELKTPWRDGTTHLVMSPLQLLQRLAALVPRPRLHLIRFHGVLAPNAKLRARVVPNGPLEPGRDNAPGPRACGEPQEPAAPSQPRRLGWARLLARVFDIDLRYCPRCGIGELAIVAVILERAVISKILTHLGLDPQPPPRGSAVVDTG